MPDLPDFESLQSLTVPDLPDFGSLKAVTTEEPAPFGAPPAPPRSGEELAMRTFEGLRGPGIRDTKFDPLATPPPSIRPATFFGGLESKLATIPGFGRAFQPTYKPYEMEEMRTGIADVPTTIPGAIATAVRNVLGGFITPENIALLSTGEAEAQIARLSPKLALSVRQAIAGYFAAQAGSSVAQGAPEVFAPGRTPEQRVQAAVETTGGAAMGLMLARHALSTKPVLTPQQKADYASSIQKAAEVYGDVQAQPGKGPGQVPTEKGGRGILTPEETQQTQVLLKPAVDANKGLGIGHEVEVLPDFGATDPKHVRVFQATAPSPDGTPGRILMSKAAFDLWLKEVPEAERPTAIKTALAEEGIHATVTGEQALEYLKTLTPAEVLAGRQLYMGEHAGTMELSPENLGQELLRQRMQRVLRMKPTELAEVAGVQRWSRASLEFISNLIRRFREMIGTKAARSGQKIVTDLLDRYDRNLAAARGEKVLSAAYIDPDGNIHTGPNHPAILAELGIADQFPTRESRNTPDFGYVTSHRPFVDRPTAAPVIEAAGQKLEDFDVQEGKPMPHSDETAAAGAPAEPLGDQPFMVRRSPPGHEEDMAFARRVASMTPDQFVQEAHGFNRINLRLGQNASPSDVTELKQLRQQAVYRLKEAMQAAAAAKTPEAMDTAIKLSSMPQFYNEAIAQAEKSPAMVRRKKVDHETREMYLPPATGAAAERGSPFAAAEVFKPKVGTGQQIFRSAHSFVQDATDAIERALAADPGAKVDPPKFGEFFTQAKKDFPGIGRGEAATMWDRAVGTRLQNASGAAIKALANSAGIKTPETIADPPSPRSEAARAMRAAGRPTETPTLAGPSEAVLGRPKPLTAEQRRLQNVLVARQKVRQSIARRIYEHLVEPAYEEAALTRKTVSPEDIARPDPERQREPTVWDITAADLKNPVMLAARLTRDGRRRLTDPVTVTKRVTSLVDRETGKAYLVSTYEHGRAGAMLADPRIAGVRIHRPLSEILEQYRPVSSFLLDEPVQNFRQAFESLGDLEHRFATDAREGARAAIGEEPAKEGTAEPPSLFQQRNRPVTPTEVAAIFDHVMQEAGDLTGPEDVKASWLALNDDIQAGRQPAAAAMSGYLKLATALQEKEPGLSDKEFADKLAKQIYDTHKASKDFQDFQRRTMGQGPVPSAEMVAAEAEPAAKAAAKTGARELTVPRFARRAEPTGRAGAPPPPAIPVRPPEMLRPEEQARIAQRAAEESQYRPTNVADALRMIGAEDPALLNDPPAMIRRTMQAAEEEFQAMKTDMVRLLNNAPIAQLVSAGLDSAHNIAHVLSRDAEMLVRVQSINRPGGFLRRKLTPWKQGNAQVLAAANALVEAQSVRRDGSIDLTGARSKIAQFKNEVEQGRRKAQDLIQQGGYRRTRLGKAWLRAVDQLKAELDYADEHLMDPELQKTAATIHKLLDDQFEKEMAAGYDLAKDKGYLPHRYDAELWSGNSVLMRKPKILGKKYREAKRFETHYEAISKGPYLAVTRDGASLVSHRLLQGNTKILIDQWKESLRGIRTPAGDPLAITPIRLSHERWGSPQQNYEVVDLGAAPGSKPIVVHEDFAPLIRTLTGKNPLKDSPIASGAINLSQQIKHTLLIGDFFHMGRIAYYGASILGKQWGWKGGWTVLDIPEQATGEAVRRGLVKQADVDWGNERVRFEGRDITRRELARVFLKEGLNVGRIQDALYKDLVTKLTPSSGKFRRGVVAILDPSVGRYNRFLFDGLSRGIMVESAVREFERQSKANPELNHTAIVRDISKDVNDYFGNIGRQGWLKGEWQQDLARLFLLAPQWVEGLLKKEMFGAYPRIAAGTARMAGLAPRYRQGLTPYGTMGSGIGKGLFAMFLLTQGINMIWRRKPTWENEEKGHKFDAFIPGWGADSNGFWLSPFAIYNEITHDLYRLSQSKPTFMQAVDQVAGNKESPLVRGALVALTGRGPTGTYQTTSAGQLRTAAEQVIPAPITFGRYIRWAGHTAFPGTIEPNVPGAEQRQFAATFGLKIEPHETALQEVQAMARDFAKERGRTEAIHFEQTDQPTYSAMRQAVRQQDPHATWKLLDKLRAQGKTEADILKSMKLWSRRNFTWNDVAEADFIAGLNEHERELVGSAQLQRLLEYQRFMEYYMSQPGR